MAPYAVPWLRTADKLSLCSISNIAHRYIMFKTVFICDTLKTMYYIVLGEKVPQRRVLRCKLCNFLSCSIMIHRVGRIPLRPAKLTIRSAGAFAKGAECNIGPTDGQKSLAATASAS